MSVPELTVRSAEASGVPYESTLNPNRGAAPVSRFGAYAFFSALVNDRQAPTLNSRVPPARLLVSCTKIRPMPSDTSTHSAPFPL